ncbi:CidA/LrgA family protein [Pasteurella sp. P03HT]
MIRKIGDVMRSFSLLYLMLWVGERIASYLDIGIPGSIWGLLLLFTCLTLRVIKLEWVLFSSNLLIRYMALLFVPVSVGIIKYADVLFGQMKIFFIPNIVSTCLTLVLIALLSDYLFSRKSFAYLRRKVAQKKGARR